MKEPRRLLVDSETSSLSRTLLAAGRARHEPEGARERVWGAIAVGIASGASTAGSAAGAATSPRMASGASIAKAKVLVGIAVAAGVASSFFAVDGGEPSAAVGAPVAAARSSEAADATPAFSNAESNEPQFEASPSVGEAKREAPPSALPAPRARTKAHPPRVETAPLEVRSDDPAATTGLREEAAVLEQARAALRHGDLRSARAKLDELRTRFAHGQLDEERDALEVRFASETGDRERAVSLARMFVARYPDSPLRAGVESIAHATEKQ